MPDPITPPVVPDPNAIPPAKVEAAPVVPPAPTIPQKTGVDTPGNTKAYSDLYNQNKTLTAEHKKLQEEMEAVKKQIQVQSDSGKDVEQLKLELNDQRTKAEQSASRMTAFDESMKGLLTAAEADLTDEQKKQLEFASDDPFKRLQFIQTMKATTVVPTKTSQGGGITDDPGTTGGVITANVITGSKNDPAKYDVAMFYPEPQISRTTSDQVAKDNFDLLHGIITPALLLMREQPDRFDSEDEAAEFLASRQPLLVTDGDAGGVEPEVDSPAQPEETPPPVDGAPDALADDDNVADEAMNGAQVAALQQMVIAVSKGEMPADSAIIAVRNAFPTIPAAEVEKMFKVAEDFEPTTESNTELQSPPTVPADIQDGPDVDDDETDEDNNNA